MRRSNHPYRLAPLVALLVVIVIIIPASAQDSTTQRTPPATRPAPSPSTQESEAANLERLRKEREAQLKAMPVAQVASLRDVVQFAIEKDDVVVRTSIPPTEQSAVVVEGQPTLISVAAQRGPEANASPYQPVFFSLMRHEFPANAGVGITQINVVAPRVHISKTFEAGGEYRNIDLIQSDEFLEEGGDRVRFYVQEHRNDQPIVDLKLSAANATELRRKYPAETLRYLEPIFRDFGQAAVLFQVNARAAWQVLGGAYEPPADVARQVDALLVKLDAENPKDRESAAAELEKLGQPAALVLLRRDRKSLTEEQQARVETFLAPYKPLSDEEAARMRGDAEFLLTVLSADDPHLVASALEQLKKVAGQPIAFDASASGSARAEAIAKLRTQLLPATTRPATTQVLKESATEVP